MKAPLPLILLAEDDEDDVLLIREAFHAAGMAADIRRVKDGVELMEYLDGARRGASAPLPHLVLLDLDMPRMDGRQALHAIKARPELRHLAVVVLTGSRAPEDLSACYRAGASSYVAKPTSFEELVQTIQTLIDYWLRTVQLAL